MKRRSQAEPGNETFFLIADPDPSKNTNGPRWHATRSVSIVKLSKPR
jgi:hypothetical protein